MNLLVIQLAHMFLALLGCVVLLTQVVHLLSVLRTADTCSLRVDGLLPLVYNALHSPYC